MSYSVLLYDLEAQRFSLKRRTNGPSVFHANAAYHVLLSLPRPLQA